LGIDSTIITIVFIALILYYIYICVLAVLVKTPRARQTHEARARFIFMIPCRNEEGVIAVTIDKVLEIDHPFKEVLIINDGSADRTEEVALGFSGSGAVQVVSTVDPGRGKGEALNFGFGKILERLRAEGVSSYEDIIVAIMDADGQPSTNICKAVEPYFDDPRVGAVQAGVRIANADANMIASCQDIEFTGFSQSIQKGRDRLGSVGLGGNGQFTRLSALSSLSVEHPWNRSLTEDLDIGVRLILAGWRVRFCSSAFVSQQGVEKIRPLVVQRVRWMQGHYSTWKYIPALLKNRNIPLRTRADNTAYLLFGATPFLVLISLIISLLSLTGLITVSNKLNEFLLRTNFILFILMFYFVSFLIAIIFVTFYMRYKKLSAWRFFLMYNVFAFYTFLWIPASLGAVINMIRGQTVWVKTGRTAIEEFIELRAYPRMDVDIPVEIEAETGTIELIAKDVSASGMGVQVTKSYFVKNAIELVSTGNTVTVITPETRLGVKSQVVWVAYLGFNQVRAGIRFLDPAVIEVEEDFGLTQEGERTA